MRRVAFTGACLGLVALVSACAVERTANDPAAANQDGDVRVLGGPGPGGSQDPTRDRRGELPGGGATSCVEPYHPRAVAGRAFAFDGVVVAVGEPVSGHGDEADRGLSGVTFEVREWFSGGRDDTVTVDVPTPTTGPTDPSEPGYAYGVGSRLLVSGEARWGGAPLDSPLAWGCGFSRYHDPGTATTWREALAR